MRKWCYLFKNRGFERRYYYYYKA